MKKFFEKYVLDNAFAYNYKRMWPFFKPYWGRALIGVLLTIPVGSLDAAIALMLRPFMDVVMVEQQPKVPLFIPFVIVGFTIVQGVLNYSASYVNTWVGNKVSIGIKRRLYEKLLSMDTSYFDNNSSGTIILRYSNDADTASSGLINSLKLFLSRFFSSLALIGVLLYNSWQLAIIAVGVLILIVYPMKIVRSKIKGIAHKTVAAGAEMMTIYNETFSGNRIIHSYTLEKRFDEKFHKTSDSLFTLAIKMVQGSNWLSPVLHFITSIGVALVVGYGSYLIVSHTISPGNFVSFIAALLMLYTPLKSIGNNFVDIQKAFLAIDRIFDIFSIVPSIKTHDGTIELKTIKEGIKFDNVEFAYSKGANVLNGISFDINMGQTVALVGSSGGGKTTISSLIPRLYDVSGGAIYIDGVNIKDYTINSLRSKIAVVFQDNVLFSGTIKENVLLGNPKASEEDVWTALRNAHLEDFVNSHPDKLDTQIGERGTLVSGGQKQRIAIARAFIKDAPVVILDEATSALDNKSEKIVQAALDNLMKNRTVIVIAHRLSTVQNADKIVVISDGRIMEQGRHDELLANKDAYYSLYAAQFKDKEEE